MSNTDVIELEGKVVEALKDTFKVALENGHEVLARLSGKMRKQHIRVVVGDKVKLEISPYDLTKGRIVYRKDERQEAGSTLPPSNKSNANRPRPKKRK